MKKVYILKVVNGTKNDMIKISKSLNEWKSTDKDLKDYQFLIMNDKIDFYSPKRFIKEMMGIVDELKKLDD